MTLHEFDLEVARLDSQWPRSYGEERKKAMWPVFRGFSAVVFSDAVTDCLLNYRQAPLVQELEKAANEAQRRERSARYASDKTLLSVMEDSAKKTSANPDVVTACIDIVKWKLATRPNEKDWQDAMGYIDAIVRATSVAQKVCLGCGGSGIAWRERFRHGNKYDCIFRCYCADGSRQQYLPPLPGDVPLSGRELAAGESRQ